MYQKSESNIIRFFRRLLNSNVIQGIIHFSAAIIMPFIIVAPESSLNIWAKLWAIVCQKQVVTFFIIYLILLILFYFAKQATIALEESSLTVYRVNQEFAAIITCLEEKLRENSTDVLPIEFDSVSQMVCNSLHLILSNHCETGCYRVRVVKQYLREGKYYYCISGYKTNNTATGSAKESLVSECKQHTRMILEGAVKDYDILLGEKAISSLVFKRKKHKSKQIRAYIAVPDFLSDDRTCFVLEVDSTNKTAFGRDVESVKSFTNEVIWPFTKLLNLIYTLERVLITKERCSIQKYGK